MLDSPLMSMEKSELMSWIATHLIGACLLPPLNMILLGGLGLLLLKSRPRLGRGLIALSLLVLYLLSTPYASDRAMAMFEGPYIPPSGNAGAIVVLGGGTYFRAPEYEGRNTVNRWDLERLRYAAHLYRKTGKPILVSGGHPLGNPDSEAAQMKAVLIEDFHIPVAWTEDESRNTAENAAKSFAILKRQNIRTVYLVTQAWHMPRAALLFRHAGFAVIPAPVGLATSYQTGLLSFVPSSGFLMQSEILLHELIGIAWFELKSPISNRSQEKP